MSKNYYIYILSNKRNEALHVGITSDLAKRVFEHKNDPAGGFTQKHALNKLVYFERYAEMNVALRWEKRLRTWQQKWKSALIEIDNPEWRDLYPEIVGS